MKLVKLTKWHSLTETYVNFDTVSEIRPMEPGGTKIYFNFNEFGGGIATTDVKESPIEIMSLLQED